MYVCSEYAKYIIKYIIDKMHQTPFSAYIRVNPSVDCYPNRSEVQKRKYRMLFNRKNHLSPDPSSRHRCYAGVNCIYIYIYTKHACIFKSGRYYKYDIYANCNLKIKLSVNTVGDLWVVLYEHCLQYCKAKSNNVRGTGAVQRKTIRKNDKIRGSVS